MWDLILNLQGPKGDSGEPGHPGERGEKGEMGLSGPAVSTDPTLVAPRFLNVILVESNSMVSAQGVDGQKGEKGDCRLDDNLVRRKNTPKPHHKRH